MLRGVWTGESWDSDRAPTVRWAGDRQRNGSDHTTINHPHADPILLPRSRSGGRPRIPGSHHALLKRLAGHWKVRRRFHAGPERWESNFTAHADLLHGGRFLLEQMSGEINAPDEQGQIRPEQYSATWLLGYDGYKKGYVGSFAENQNSYLLTFVGRKPLGYQGERIELYGLSDEPMLGLGDGAMKYVLEVHDDDHRTWRMHALAAGRGNRAVRDAVRTIQLMT